MTRATRITDPSYELMDDHNGLSIIYRQHGFPCPLVRWHFHKEYELHLIVASSGKVFIGDYIGNFYPESLFLTGPNLPHNWISQVEEDEVVPKRDMLVNFTDELFHNLGVGWNESGKTFADPGRWVATPPGAKNIADFGAFKTPTCRDIEKTAPYMHDGSEATLEAVIDYYDRGGNANPTALAFFAPFSKGSDPI